MDQGQFIDLFRARPQNFAWFLGAGASRTAGMPTATDILWDLKRQHYCREENQDVSRQDIQNAAVQARIQAFMDARGFPAAWADEEYTTYFEKIFGADRERQRRYMRDMLFEDKVTLAVGNRVFGALIASGLCRIAFTTNFDSVVERAVAEVSGQSLAAFHLEGSHAAVQAINNEEYPIYCKLHGDFRYDSLKNLSTDLAAQNAELSKGMVNSASRFGFIVSGYSGRDQSVMELFHSALEASNPFPHGLFWTEIKGRPLLPSVKNLLEAAREMRIEAHHVPVETGDAFLLRLWRNIPGKSQQLDRKVRRSEVTTVSITMPTAGRGKPLLRLNALPIVSLPEKCMALSFKSPKDWEDVRSARAEAEGALILTKLDTICCWGSKEDVSGAFQGGPPSISPREIPKDLDAAENLIVKSFIEEALSKALARGKPLLSRTTRSGTFLIADRLAESVSELDPLFQVVGKTSGIVDGLFAPVTEDHPHPEKVYWAEAVRISIDQRNGQHWLLIRPDIWIWPPRARKIATTFLDGRRGDRFNKKHNELLDAWTRIILGTSERNTEVSLSAFDGGDELENPSFILGTRTAFTRRLS